MTSEGVGEYRGDRRHHRDHCPDGTDEAGGRRRDPNPVEAECEGQVLSRLAVGRHANLMGVHYRTESFIHDDDVGGLDSDVGPGADCNTDVSLGEGGGVVDPVTNHHHPNPATLEVTDLGGFLVGENFGEDILDADLGGNCLGGALVVAGDHHRSDPGFFYSVDGLGGVVFDGVRDADEPEKLAVASHRDDSLAFVLETFPIGV